MDDVIVSFGPQCVRHGPESFSAHGFQLMVTTLQDLLVPLRWLRVNLLPVHKLSVLHPRTGVNLPVVRLGDGEHGH